MIYEKAISTFDEYITEGAYSLRLAIAATEKIESATGPLKNVLNRRADLHSRYAFLMFANSLEAAANAFLLDLYLEDHSYKELEKLNTLAKIYIYCDVNGTPADKGNKFNAHIKEIISCRNEFVHPKPIELLVDTSTDPHQNVKKTKTKDYPLYFGGIEMKHSITALKDILGFLSWIVFDVCKSEIDDGASMINFLEEPKYPTDIIDIGKKNNIKFDLRIFNVT